MENLFNMPTEIDKIELKRTINKLFSEAKTKAKPETCILCGKNQTSFCNSHSVPKMSLQSIAEAGMVLHASSVLGFDPDVIKSENGINKSGTFQYICRNCDGTFFRDYEDPLILKGEPTDKMMAEIAVKNFLLQISKRAVEIELYEGNRKEFSMLFANIDEAIEEKHIDMEEFKRELLFHKNVKEKNMNNRYNVLFKKILPYKVPIAMQSAIPVTKDMSGKKINDIYSKYISDRLQYLHLIVVPIDDCSLVLAFYHKRDNKYKKLRQQISGLSDENALKYINYLIFKYTENYFITKELEHEVNSNKKLRQLSQEKDESPDLGILGMENNYGAGYKPVKIDEIPNYLSPDWAI